MASEAGPVDPGIDRFWCPTDGSYSLDDYGFLADPDQTWFGSSSANPDAERLDAFIEDRCLVLLGEPGTGKSTAVRSQILALPSTTEHVVDLASYGSEDRLVREAFDSHTVLSWAAGAHHLNFTLDSLDEARTRIPHVGEIIADQLRRLPVDRLLLRIACRTADWPTALGRTLSELFGTVIELEILPLRQRDAAALASRWCDPASFMNAIRAAGAGPLAARPITLGFLGRAFGRTGHMPHRGAELYAAGVRQLCEEQNPRRSDALHSNSSTLEERLTIARRVAAASIFGGKTAVWIGPDTQAGDDDTRIVELIGTSSRRAFPDRADSTAAPQEVLRTALFSGRGEHRLGWAHATFADYLAADWITKGGLGPDQTRALFLAPDGSCWPQTRLAAAWAVAIAPGRFKFLIHSDPGAFRGEVELPGDELRAAVIDGLFENADSADVRPWESSYHALRHAGIADQLRAHLTDPDPGRRRLALQLARECVDLDMHDDLVEIALDATLDLADRVAAASALEQLPNEHRTSALRELALSDHIAGDTNDDLRGSALLASWPHAITTAEALQALAPRRRSNYLGAYAHFLSRLREAVAVDDVTAGLGWILGDVALPAKDDLLGALANAIMRRGRGMQVPRTDLVEAVSRVIELRAHDYQSLLYEDLTGQDSDVLDDVDLRRAVVLNLLKVPPSDETLFHMSSIGTGQLSAARSEDFAWLCEISTTADEQLLQSTRRLALWTFDVTMVEHRNLVFGMAKSHPLFTDFTNSWIDAVDLSQPDIIQLREMVQRRNSRRPGSGANDRVGEDIRDLLERYRSGESEAFWQATRLLYVPPNTRHYRDEQDPDPVKMPRWITLSSELQESLFNASEYYLQNESCRTSEWLTKPNIRFFPAEAGYRAMIMLLRTRPEALARLQTRAWVEWAPALAVAFRTAYVNGADRKDKEKLLTIAGPTGREAARSALLVRLQASDDAGMRPLLSHEAEMLWDSQVSSAISALIDRATSADVRDEMVELLAKMSFSTIGPRLLDWAHGPIEAERRDSALVLLLRHDMGGSWNAARPILAADVHRAEEVLGRVLHSRDFTPSPPIAADLQAEIYLWLRQNFPPESDPQFEDAHIVGARERIGQWRDAILRGLEAEGTAEAVDALGTIQAALPKERWLTRVIAAARSNMRRNTWTPTPIDQLLLLEDDADAAIVNDLTSLGNAVDAAIDRLQRRLTGATPESHLLWDSHSGRPKTEDAISDYLSVQLNQELIENRVIVNREVQIRRNRPTGMGERTDLLIDAFSLTGHHAARLSLPVEVKGAWNSELLTALREQLVDRYMQDVGSDRGMYVVVWPDDASWTDDTDHRRAKIRALDRRAVRDALAEEARSLEKIGLSVAVRHLDISYRRAQGDR